MKERRLLLAKPIKQVDLGLPSGKKWAEYNIGSESYSDPGLYFSWGNITGYNPPLDGYNFNSANYNTTPGKSLTSEIPRNPTYDVAQVILGRNWTIPTRDDFTELNDNCTITQYTTTSNAYGAIGKLFTSKINGNSIFIPCGGYYDNTTKNYSSYLYLWTKNYSSSSSADAGYSSGTSLRSTTEYRYYGLNIRPIYSPIIPGLSTSPSNRTVEPTSGSYQILKVYYDSSLLANSNVSISYSGQISSASYNSSNGQITYEYKNNQDYNNPATGTITVTYNGESTTFTLNQLADYTYEVNASDTVGDRRLFSILSHSDGPSSVNEFFNEMACSYYSLSDLQLNCSSRCNIREIDYVKYYYYTSVRRKSTGAQVSTKNGRYGDWEVWYDGDNQISCAMFTNTSNYEGYIGINFGFLADHSSGTSVYGTYSITSSSGNLINAKIQLYGSCNDSDMYLGYYGGIEDSNCIYGKYFNFQYELNNFKYENLRLISVSD